MARAGRDGERRDLRISIRNLGPISEGVIDLRPLTILTGPNNSGKSYAAALVHSIVSAENGTLPAPDPSRLGHLPLLQRVYGRFGEIPRAGGALRAPVPGRLAGRIRAYVLRELFPAALLGHIAASLGPAGGLARRGAGPARVAVRGGFSASLAGKVSVRRASPRDGAGGPDLESLVRGIIKESRIPGTPPASARFPAARSALLESWMRGADVTGSMGPCRPVAHSPRLAGTIADHDGALLLPDERGPLYGLGSGIESDLLSGSIDLKTNAGARREILYRSRGTTVPLQAASAAASEIAPVTLYLKHVAVPGSLLVIEEPESHLHVGGQVVMARCIVRMVRAGLRVLLTTHSSPIIDEISTYMQSSRASPAARRRSGLRPGDYLEFDEVAPYEFKKSGRGHAIRGIRADDEGIPHADYVGELERIYDRTCRLGDEMDAERGGTAQGG